MPVLLLVCAGIASAALPAGYRLRNPIVFVHQVPVTATDNTVVSIGGSHLATTKAAPRGGGLMIRYHNGQVKDLTAAAGYGVQKTLQVGDAIAVRDPAVHWSGEKVLFSMVVGAPRSRSDSNVFYWQLYEVANLGKDETPVITKVPGQPSDYNNIQGTYTSDDRIIFVSDKSISDNPYLYPARNEQGGESVTGLWSLDPQSGAVKMMDHSPSGSFEPFVDSFGRVVFSRWDHLQQDSSASALRAVDYLSEDSVGVEANWSDIFPEAIQANAQSLGHKFDLFFPWTMNQDGTGLLTMNHLGRHELGLAFERARRDDNLQDFAPPTRLRAVVGGMTRAGSYLHLTESRVPGEYVATDALSTATSAGRLVVFDSPPDKNPDDVRVYLGSNVGFARDPYYLENGSMVASHVPGPTLNGSYGSSSGQAGNTPSFIPATTSPFVIRLAREGTNLANGTNLVGPVHVVRTNYIDKTPKSFQGALWQLQPVELVARPVPKVTTDPLPTPELKMFEEAGVSPHAFKQWMTQNDLALVVSRDVTSRDKNDKQQPFNLTVPGGTSTIADGGKTYDVTNLQFFQGDYVRGYDDSRANASGRRVTPRVMHEDRGENIPSEIAGSAEIQSDGSTAMLLPAGRAVTWQLTNPHGEAVVRERYWLTFQAGEIRSCTNCHGSNTEDQRGRTSLDNPPLALKRLLVDWQSRHAKDQPKVTPFQLWAEINLGVEESATGDANGDGMSNMEAYAYGFSADGRPGTDQVAKPLTISVRKQWGHEFTDLEFTLSTENTNLRVTVERSADLTDWTSAAVIEGVQAVSEDGTLRVLSTSSSELDERKLRMMKVRGVRSRRVLPDMYYRLRFEEILPEEE